MPGLHARKKGRDGQGKKKRHNKRPHEQEDDDAAAAGKRRKTRNKPLREEGELDDIGSSAAVADAVERDLDEARLLENMPRLAPEKGDDEEDDEEDGAAEEEQAPEGPADPYLMADATYIQKDTRWRNKQRTLVFASRGVSSRFRHLCEDIKKLLPHHKAEPKFEKRSKLHEINEVCELKACNNVIFFEARKGKDLYMYVGRVPTGPTFKFQVHNIHTTAEVRLAGNCLLGSRPILYFDKNFDNLSYLQLFKELMTQTFGTPRNHPKSKPFHDHVMSFYYLDRKIWFRHYQVAPEAPDANDDPERQALTEIGPRFVLDPIRICNGSFMGQTLYHNPHYMSPTALRVQAKKLLRNPYVKRLKDKEDREKRREANIQPEDPTDEAFV